MILADTSIWIDYLRGGNAEMEKRLGAGQIAMHPFIVGEIALGSLRRREKLLEELDALQQVTMAESSEVRHMIEARELYSRGIGLVDAHLIASCLMTPGTLLWTRDATLVKTARSVGVAIHES